MAWELLHAMDRAGKKKKIKKINKILHREQFPK